MTALDEKIAYIDLDNCRAKNLELLTALQFLLATCKVHGITDIKFAEDIFNRHKP